MYDSACEQCKLYDAGSEAGATQVGKLVIAGIGKLRWHWMDYADLGAATLELEKTCAYEENNGSRVKIEDGGNEYGNEFN